MLTRLRESLLNRNLHTLMDMDDEIKDDELGTTAFDEVEVDDDELEEEDDAFDGDDDSEEESEEETF